MVRKCDQDGISQKQSRQQAITELYQRYAPALLLYLRSRTASAEDAEDVLLEIFLAALLQENLLEEPVSDDLIPEERLLRQEEDMRLHLALERLSPLQRETLYLRFVQNQRCADIGKRLGKSVKATRSLLARTLNHLRRIYGNTQEE